MRRSSLGVAPVITAVVTAVSRDTSFSDSLGQQQQHRRGTCLSTRGIACDGDIGLPDGGVSELGSDNEFPELQRDVVFCRSIS